MTKLALTDRRIELLGVVLVAAIMTSLDRHAHATWVHYLVGLVFTASMWEGNRQVLLSMQRRFAEPDQTLRRLLIQVPLQVIITVLISGVLEFLVVRLLLGRMCTYPEIAESALFSLVPTAIVSLIYESRFFFQQWRENAVRVEQLARTQAQSQLEALRNQVDPHFLFNSLNTLAALIDDDAAAAQQYLSQLADVYRYVLLVREKDTVTLAEELAFVDAYLYLSKARFRDNLQIENTIPAALGMRRVAPLSIQTLVENALKHNVASREHPLTLRLEAIGSEAIRVVNSLRPKTTLVSGTRVGLKNLLSRYALLTSHPVEVYHDEQVWAVRLPLI